MSPAFKPTLDRAPPPSPAQRLLGPPLLLGVLFLLLVGALVLLGRLWWLGDVLASFRVLGLAAGLLAAPLLIALRAPRWAAAALCGAAVHGAPLLPWAQGAAAGEADGPTLRVLSFNAWTGNPRPQAVRALVEAEEPDLVAIFELSTPLALELEGPSERLPYQIVAQSDDHNFGIGIYCRYPLEGAGLLEAGSLSPSSTPGIDVRVRIPGAAPLRVLLTHPMPPVGARAAAQRDAQLLAVAGRARQEPGPVLLLGDFNLSPLSPTWGPLLAASGLRDARRVQGGLTGTWPASWPAPLRIPIDHAWLSEAVAVEQLAVGEAAGSDHLPLHLLLRLPAATGGPR